MTLKNGDKIYEHFTLSILNMIAAMKIKQTILKIQMFPHKNNLPKRLKIAHNHYLHNQLKILWIFLKRRISLSSCWVEDNLKTPSQRYDLNRSMENMVPNPKRRILHVIVHFEPKLVQGSYSSYRSHSKEPNLDILEENQWNALLGRPLAYWRILVRTT